MDLAVFEHPLPSHGFATTTLGGAPRHECYYANVSDHMSSIVTHRGQDLELHTLLSKWDDAGHHITMANSRGVRHHVAVQIPDPFLNLIVNGIERCFCLTEFGSADAQHS